MSDKRDALLGGDESDHPEEKCSLVTPCVACFKNKQKAYRVSWTLVTMVMTFLIYASFHMTRKIPSTVMDVLNPINSEKESVYGIPVKVEGKGNETCNNTGWEPFNDDLNPNYVNQASVGIVVSNVSNTVKGTTVDGHYLATTGTQYASYQLANSVAEGAVIVYCHTISAALAESCQFSGSLAYKTSAWVISKNTTNNPCNANDVLFAVNTTSPVPNAVGKNETFGKGCWNTCEQAGNDAKSPSVKVSGLDSTGTAEWADMITLYLGFYAVGLFIAGHVADRMNKKLFVSIGMAGSAATVALVGLAYNFNVKSSGYFWVVMGVMGLFQATGWPAVVSITGPWLGKGKRGLLMGIWNSHTSVGNIMGNIIGAAGLDVAMDGFDCGNNWPMAFILAAVAMTGINLLSVIVLKSHPKHVGLGELEVPEEEGQEIEEVSSSKFADDEEEKKDKRSTFVRALCVPGLIEFAFCLFFCKLVAYTFIYWGPTYVAHGGLDAADAARYSSFLDYGGIIGGITAGFVADRIKSQALVAFGCLLGGIAALYIFRTFTATISEDQLTEYKLLMMMVGIFVNAPYALITTAVSADLGTTTKGDADLMATVTGIIDGTGSIGAAIQGALIAWVSANYGWTTVFYLLMMFLAASALCLVRLVFRDSKKMCCSKKRVEGE